MRWYFFSRLCYEERIPLKTKVKNPDLFSCFNIWTLIITLSDTLTNMSFSSCNLHFQIILTVSI